LKVDALEKRKKAEPAPAEAPVELASPQVADESAPPPPTGKPKISDTIKYGAVIGGVAVAAIAFFCRNQIRDGFQHMTGKKTEKERQNDVVRDMASDVPSEFSGTQAEDKPDISSEPLAGFGVEAFSAEAIIKDRTLGWKPPAKDIGPKKVEDPFSRENIIKDRSLGWKPPIKDEDFNLFANPKKKKGGVKKDPFLAFDTIHEPMGAEEELIRGAVSNEAGKDARRSK